MKVPNIGSKIKVRVTYSQGPRMFPPQPKFTELEGEVISPYKWLNDREFCITGDKNFPIRVINMDLVEDIQLLSGSFKTVDTGVKVYTVKGSKGNEYTVIRNGKGWSCTCPGATFRGNCKHITNLSSSNC